MTYRHAVRRLPLLAACLSLFGASAASAQYSKMVVLSDSMSDTHRYYDFTKALFGTGDPRPPAFDGRFCNGPVAVEVLAKGMGVEIENYAFSGALSGYLTLIPGIPLGVLSQVTEHLNRKSLVPSLPTVPVVGGIFSVLPGTGRADPKALYVIWTGPDDYYFPGGMNALTAYKAAANIQQAITSLYNTGARYFFVPTMPDLGITPRALQLEKSRPGYIANASKYSVQFSDVLSKALQASARRYPQARIMSFDTLTFLKTEMDKGRAEGKNLTEACHPGGLNLTQFETRPVCADPDNYLFWDDNHPTAEANRRLGSAWLKAISTKP
jgi:phospholipase/lecithinase/hemolysin